MKKISLLLIALIALPLYGQITIRYATQDDLPALMDLDLRVSFHDFVSLVPQYYTEYFTEQQYIDTLVKEVEKDDFELFQKGINFLDFNRVHIAIDEQSNTLVGYVTYVKEGNTLKLNFIAVDSKWRRQHIGSRLIQTALAEFSDITSSWTGPLQCHKPGQSFLESLGFINKGPGPKDVMNVFGFSCAIWYYKYELLMEKN